MNSHKQPERRQTQLRAYLLTAFAMMFLLGLPDEVSAQSQWTTNGNNINNTNTGNVGIGTTTPNGKLVVLGGSVGLGSNDMETWTNSSAVIESLNTSIFFGQVTDLHMVSNAYNSSGWKYKATGPVADFYLYNGMHGWRTAPSGTIDTAITWTDAMTLTNSGNLGIGTTSPSHRLHIAGNNTTAGGFPLVKLQNTQAGGHSYWLYAGAINNPADFGLFDETDNLYRLYVKGGTGNIGMGTHLPRGALDVAGGESYAIIGATGSMGSGAILSGSTGSTFLSNNVYLNAAANQFKVVDSTKISAGLQLAGRDVYFRSFTAATTPLHTELFFINGASGNVGIGTITPLAKFEVGGSVYSASAPSNTVFSGVVSSANANFIGSGGYWALRTATNNSYNLDVYNAGASLTAMTVAQSGNVGIGTSAPAYKLDITGSLNATGGLCIAADCKTSWAQVGGSQWTTSGNNINNANTGNVGIGTTSPQTRLHIDSLTGSFAQQLRLSYNNNAAGWGLATGSDSKLYFANGSVGAESPKVVIDTTGKVGVGTTTPQAQLQVGIIPRTSALTYAGSATESNNGLLLNAYYNSSDGWKRYADIVSVGNADGFNGGSLFRFFTNPVGSPVASERLRIDGNGNVGIGTSAPAAKLDVNGNTNVTGNITVTGNINAKYQDVAEWVPSRQKLTPGTVVVLDTEQSNHVLASSSAYDTRVAGVVSAQPGVILGEGGENKAMIATTGRVKIKVDATRTPIRIGDLLVTSEREGYAMKSEPISVGGRQLHAPGTLLGKALEPLEKGTGEILVLLSLQ